MHCKEHMHGCHGEYNKAGFHTREESRTQLTVGLGHGCTKSFEPGMQIDTGISKTKVKFTADKNHKAVMAATFKRVTEIKHLTRLNTQEGQE